MEIDGDIFTVAHHNSHLSAIAEDGAYLAIVYRACLAAFLTLYVYALVVKLHILQTFHSVGAAMAANLIASRDRRRQSAAVACKR